MPGLTEPTGQDGQRRSATIRRVLPEQRHAALGLLLTGRLRGSEAAVEDFLGFAAEQHLHLDNVWTATLENCMVASTMVIPCAGRAAMIFASPTFGAKTSEITSELVKTACLGQDTSRVRLIQALLEPGQDDAARMYEAAGFKRLATLLYMQREVDANQEPWAAVQDGLELSPWNGKNRDLFSRAILASYEGTQDCPGLLGVRRIDDIIDGHMGTGRFLPQLWCVLHRDNEPAGVMLMNPLSKQESVELAYVGLSSKWRGKGLGAKLLRAGLSLAAGQGAKVILCAVDQENAPALEMYRRLQFVPSGAKTVMIMTLD